MATHYFLSQLIGTMRKNMNFSDLSTLVSIAQAAAKSTTISDTLNGASNLEGLITGLNKVPSKNITMMTMPWEYDPNDNARVLPLSSAKTVFTDLQNDTSFTNTTAKASTAKSAAPKATTTPAPAAASVDKSEVSVHVYNADGVAGRATTIVDALSSDGFSQAQSAGNAATVTSSLVYYDSSSDKAGAQAVASALNIPAAQVQQNSNFAGVNVFIGSDFESGAKFTPLITTTATAPKADTSGAASAPPGTGESFATDSSTECVPWFSGSGSGTLSLVQE